MFRRQSGRLKPKQNSHVLSNIDSPKPAHAVVQLSECRCGWNGGVAIAISSVFEYRSVPLFQSKLFSVSQLTCSRNVGRCGPRSRPPEWLLCGPCRDSLYTLYGFSADPMRTLRRPCMASLWTP
ncbi:hypothetical protein IscW_ISCW006988 [Ixodes scapularis]|uniref:Uncharacterized protein n=1 Tax=Ixodes scapularis TaxID=6945 RepID=B7PSX8_IXOSC|nr:hypothetical protein IscW_ISCW006988 [Ixodes scapularis]|eukprot:XP_002403243.1 hypothetical protein IscW_ISCW006988 [Ixodes scapularis]